MEKQILLPRHVILLSVIAGVATYMGVAARSWGVVVPMLLLAGLVCGDLLVYGIALGLSRVAGRIVKRDDLFAVCYRLSGFVFLGGVLFMLVSPAERLYLVNADTYPQWLTTNIGRLDMARLQQLREQRGPCHEQPAEIFRKQNGWVVRCGWFPFSQTYFADSVADDFNKD